MKIKLDFVTNSSSSSFLLIVEKKYFEETIAKEHPFVQAVANSLKKEIKVLGQDAIIIQTRDTEDFSTVSELEIHYQGEIPTNHKGELLDNQLAYERICRALTDKSKTFEHYEEF